MENINKIIGQQINLVKPSEETVEGIKKISKSFCGNLRKKLKNKKIKAEVFIGGSLAKNTMVKTDDNIYDVDIFVRFDKKYEDIEISKILEKALARDAKKIHGSRDYYQFKINNMIIEVIPVLKIKNPKEARNVTDLSYFHVNYILKKIRKNKKLSDEIIIAKAFAHSQNCYGAESYIKGFSGYSIELLVIHYGGFLKFIRAIAYSKKNEKIIIDDIRFYNRKNILREMNEAKILSPIILVDPTFKERNALSGLSTETFLRFQKSCQEFLKNPEEKFFRKKDIHDEMRNYKNLRVISVRTNRQKGDIAGTKSKKFFDFFIYKVKKEFEIRRAEFEYKENSNVAYYYAALDKKPEEIIKGPRTTMANNLNNFKKYHPDAFIKEGFAYAKISHNSSFEDFLRNFLEKDKKIIKAMSIKEIKIIE